MAQKIAYPISQHLAPIKEEDKKALEALAEQQAEQAEQLDAEEAARVAADEQLQANIDAEAQAREDADTALDGRVTTLEECCETVQTDITNLQETGTQLQANIDAEAQAREDADTALDGRVTTLEECCESAATKAEVEAETAAREAADQTLTASIESAAADATEALTGLDNTVKKTLPDGEYIQTITGSLKGTKDNEHNDQIWQIGQTSTDSKRFFGVQGQCNSIADPIPLFAQTSLSQQRNVNGYAKNQVGYNYNGSDLVKAHIGELEAYSGGVRLKLYNYESEEMTTIDSDFSITMRRTANGTYETRQINLWDLAQ